MPTRLPATMVALALCLFAVPALPDAARASGPRFDTGERALLRAINQARRSHGLRRLRACGFLARAADGHSRDMARRGFFGHTSSDGSSVGRRVARHTRARQIGENLAYTTGASSAYAIVGMWLGSAAHRQILLAPGFDRVGIARRTGRLRGRSARLITADFASNR
jgi:uncharacterized protein YkwD